jgi:hypothetical protein
MGRSRFGAGWLVIMRLGVTTRLSTLDLTALPFAIAGPLLLTIVLRRGLVNQPSRMDRRSGPVALISSIGSQFASVAHLGAERLRHLPFKHLLQRHPH